LRDWGGINRSAFAHPKRDPNAILDRETLTALAKSYVDDKANYQKDAGVVPLSLRNYMSMLMGRKVVSRPIVDK
jgi:hypothetical protein